MTAYLVMYLDGVLKNYKADKNCYLDSWCNKFINAWTTLNYAELVTGAIVLILGASALIQNQILGWVIAAFGIVVPATLLYLMS